MSYRIIIVCDACRYAPTPPRYSHSIEEAESVAAESGFIRPQRPVHEHVCADCAARLGEVPA